MFHRKGPWLGQVPLVVGPSSWGAGIVPSQQRASEPGASLEEGQEIGANGGKIVKKIGFLWFFPDEDARDKIEEATGERPSESVEARVTHCNPTPGTFPSLGDFVDPQTNLVCFIDLPESWKFAWMGLPAELSGPGNQGTPPYYGQWAIHVGGSEIWKGGQVGPFDTQDEAFSAAVKAVREAGAKRLPDDGFAQVVDSKGQAVGPVT